MNNVCASAVQATPEDQDADRDRAATASSAPAATPAAGKSRRTRSARTRSRPRPRRDSERAIADREQRERRPGERSPQQTLHHADSKGGIRERSMTRPSMVSRRERPNRRIASRRRRNIHSSIQHEHRKGREAQQPDRNARQSGSPGRTRPSALPATRRSGRGANRGRREAGRRNASSRRRAQRRRQRSGRARSPRAADRSICRTARQNRTAPPPRAAKRVPMLGNAATARSSVDAVASCCRLCHSRPRSQSVTPGYNPPASRRRHAGASSAARGKLHAAERHRQEGARRRPQGTRPARQGCGVRHRRRAARQVPAQGQVLLGGRRRLRLLRRRVRLGHGATSATTTPRSPAGTRAFPTRSRASTWARIATCRGTTACRSSSATS